MDRFIKELMVGNIHLRDKWQIELKSEFLPLAGLKTNTYTQEFFFFIPNSLQINEETYAKNQFYRDRTNFLRYKTPEFTLRELCDTSNQKSPLIKLQILAEEEYTDNSCHEAEDELKLLGNVVRSAIREEVKAIVNQMRADISPENAIQRLCEEIEIMRTFFFSIQGTFQSKWKKGKLNDYFYYVDEFVSTTVNYYLTGLLSEIRGNPSKASAESIETLCSILAGEQKHRKAALHEPSITGTDQRSNEFILYRSGLLNKFILDALLLSTRGASVRKRFENIIGSVAAGIAMLFFFVLFVYQAQVLIINSVPFIMLTVLLYILKDRIKEAVKKGSFKRLSRWFYDYSTDIFSPDDSTNLGKLNETVAFLDEENLSKEILDLRNRGFHDVLEIIKRPEKVIYYKKVLRLFNPVIEEDPRRQAMNLIFRYNISYFLSKADNPTHDYLKVDPETFDFTRATLPKVYHINIITKDTYLNEGGKLTVELKKFRLIVDKNGIKRIELPRPVSDG